MSLLTDNKPGRALCADLLVLLEGCEGYLMGVRSQGTLPGMVE
jgi:hypothetical protein